MTFEEFLKSTKEMSQADFDGLSQEEQDAIRAEFDALEDEPAIEADGDSFVDDEAFYAWLASQDVTVEQYTEMSDDEKAALQAEYAASGQASSPVVTANLGKPTRKRAAPVSNSAESTRIVALQAMFGQHPDFLRDAIAKGWSTNNANAIFKARKGKQTMKRKALQANIGVGQSRGGIGRNQSDIMTAAFAKTFGLTEDNICKKMFNGDKTRTDAALTAAAGQFRMGCGYSDLILTALDSRDRKLTSDHLKAVAYQSSQNAVNRILKPALQASLGFSTVDATAIIDFTHQAFVEQEYESVEFIADTIAKVVEVEDTTKLEMYRSTILGRLQEIANSGEIKNLSFTVEKTEAHAKPMGGVFSLSEEYILNDSIGIFNGLMSDIAINAAQSYEDDVLAYVREMMAGDVLASDGQPFFSVARGNLLTGAASQLNTNGLSAALRAFRGARDLNGKPVSVSPKNLIIPPALEWIASVIYSSTETNAVDNNGNAQVYKGKFLPVTSPLLGTGNEGHVGLISDLAWLLAADPQRIPFVKALKVRGFSTPRVVSSTMDLSVWGTKYQVIYPYGVASGDTRGAVLMTGE